LNVNVSKLKHCQFTFSNSKWFGCFREVWPENDAFGAADADAEDEFMALREILFADIPKPDHLRETDGVKIYFL
jgi:hypothetical protein